MKKILLATAILLAPQLLANESQSDGLESSHLAVNASSHSAGNTLHSDGPVKAFHPVFLKTYDFYKPSERVYSFAIIEAKDLESGEVYKQEREIDPYWYEAIRGTELEKLYRESNGVIFLRPGTYHFSGHDNFCFLKEDDITIKADTQSLDLLMGCE